MRFQKSLENKTKIRLSAQDLMEILCRRHQMASHSPSIGKKHVSNAHLSFHCHHIKSGDL